MNVEEIEKFVEKNFKSEQRYVKITFKKREAIYGMFIKDKDYLHLKSKNFWRIVTKLHFNEFETSNDFSLARIFNGSEFSKLVPYSESVKQVE